MNLHEGRMCSCFARMCEAHKQGKLQGKDLVWEFVQDIFHNVVRSKLGRRFIASTQSIYEMIKFGEVLYYIALLA